MSIVSVPRLTKQELSLCRQALERYPEKMLETLAFMKAVGDRRKSSNLVAEAEAMAMAMALCWCYIRDGHEPFRETARLIWSGKRKTGPLA